MKQYTKWKNWRLQKLKNGKTIKIWKSRLAYIQDKEMAWVSDLWAEQLRVEIDKQIINDLVSIANKKIRAVTKSNKT